MVLGISYAKVLLQDLTMTLNSQSKPAKLLTAKIKLSVIWFIFNLLQTPNQGLQKPVFTFPTVCFIFKGRLKITHLILLYDELFDVETILSRYIPK